VPLSSLNREGGQPLADVDFDVDDLPAEADDGATAELGEHMLPRWP